jgi:hypothetical protein
MAWSHTNVWAGGQLLATYSAILDANNQPDGALHFYLNDRLGTRRVQTDYAGVLEQTCSSLPFGDSLNCTQSTQFPTEHHFTGKERDGSVSYISGGWTIAGIGYFNGNGTSDILWENTSTGSLQVYDWLMSGTTISATGNFGYVSTNWQIDGLGSPAPTIYSYSASYDKVGNEAVTMEAADVGAAAKAAEASGGLKTPGSYFGGKTADEANSALESKFGPAKSSRPGADTHFDAKNGRSYNVHTDPAHGDPHVDIRKRGPTPDRKIPLKKDGQ